MLARGRHQRRRDGFRRDIQGLRAVAIVAVVGYHAVVPHMGGGYVGVDVFYVISGYLITGMLARELTTTGRISVATFYARRARRLLPSAVVVVLATAAAAVVLLPAPRAAQVLRDAVAAAAYVANYRFAVEATDYLHVGAAPSPLLHYWSLGVEEQFYLLWPALLVGAGALAARRRRRSRVPPARPDASPRRTAFAVLVVLAAASFAVSVWLTRADGPWAFYSLPSRAWELAAGGLVALAEPRIARLPRWGAAATGWAGLAAIVWSVVALRTSTPFPGTAALAPALGAAAVITGGAPRPRAGPGAVLGLAPCQWLGKVSYTWYLWHWPALVLAPTVVGHPLGLAGNLEAVGASLALAVATTIALEDPLRRSAWLGVARRGLLLAGLSTSVAVGLVATTAVLLPPARGHGTARHQALAVRARPPAARRTQAAATGAAATASALTAEVQAAVRRSVGVRTVPANLQPTLTRADADEPVPFVDGCFDGFPTTAVNPCDYGDPSGTRTMVLFGDSHALMWFPAFDTIAKRARWRLVAAAKATCPPIDIRVFSPDLDEWYTQCTQWRAAEVARIEALRPALVVLGFSREYGVGNDHVLVDGAAWLRGLAQMVRTLQRGGARVVVMGDVPYPSGLVPNCLATHLSNATACLIPKEPPAYNLAGIAEERATVVGAGGGYIDTEPWFCATQACAVMVENMVVYRDDNHITATYATWLTPVVQADLAVASGGLVPLPTRAVSSGAPPTPTATPGTPTTPTATPAAGGSAGRASS